MIPSNLNRSMNFRTLILSHFGCGLGQGGCLEDSPAWLLVLSTTNLSHTYDENAVYTLPPFGLSDHNVVIVRTKKRPSRAGPSRKLISRRDTRASRKAELGRFFSAVDWSILDSAPNRDSCVTSSPQVWTLSCPQWNLRFILVTLRGLLLNLRL